MRRLSQRFTFVRSARIAVLTAIVAALAGPAAAEPARSRAALTLEGAQRALDAAILEARKDGTGAIAVVDAGGYLLAFARLDGTFDAAPLIALGKARTSAMFRKPTKVFEDLINQGRTTMVTVPDFTPLQGGVPISIGEQVVGAIGVSGAASAQRDEDVAKAGAAALSAVSLSKTSAPVTHLGGERVAAAFRAGAPLFDAGSYKVNASRRDAPGEAEVHEGETDIMYVLDGRATLVTGGEVVAGKTIGAGEIRGPKIEGGTAQQLAKGDVVVVPSGIPHWFSDVEAPFVYYVVKVTS